MWDYKEELKARGQKSTITSFGETVEVVTIENPSLHDLFDALNVSSEDGNKVILAFDKEGNCVEIYTGETGITKIVLF